MSGADLALTGVPRGGTTLACRLLGLCDDTLALFEPMDVGQLAAGDPAVAVDQILNFFGQVRRGVLQDGTAPSKQRDGQVPDNPFGDERAADGRRKLGVAPGTIRITRPLTPAFTLAIKHNAAFAALLPALAARVRTLAIVRNPLAVLASWNSVNLPVQRGRLPAGERLDPQLAQQLAAEPSRLERQLRVLEWFFSRFDMILPTPDVLRYEDIVASQGAVLRDRAGLSGHSDATLEERNANSAYDRRDVEGLAEALLRRAGPWERWYPADALAGLATRMLPRGDP